MADSIISLSGICFGWTKNVPLLDNIDIDIPRGQITGIIGPSGCGKSTLLRLIAGLTRPSAGRVTWNTDPQDDARHKLAMVFQSDTLVPSKTVAANVGMYYRYNRHGRPTRRDRDFRVAEVLEMVGLSAFAGYYPRQLSGGMRRRAAFASALVASPQLLMLDEPFSAVDEPTRIGIHGDILDALIRTQMSAVLVTHDLAEAISLCSTIVLLTRPPASVARTYTIAVPRNVTMRRLRETSEFLEYYRILWRDLADIHDGVTARTGGQA